MKLYNFSIKSLLVVMIICILYVGKGNAFELSDVWTKPFSLYSIGMQIGNETHVIERANHADKGYNLIGLSYEFIKILDKKWDFSVELGINRHVIYDYEFTEYFSTLGARLWFTRNFLGNDKGTFYSGIGGGFGTIYPRERKSANYVGTSGIIGLIGVKLGYKRYYNWGNLKIEYATDHFSCPINKQNGEDKDDTGTNYDVTKAAVEILF